LKFKYFVLGSGERNDYKEESTTLLTAKKDKNSANVEALQKFEKRRMQKNLKRKPSTEKLFLKTRKVI
jgi:hypothetical protein